MKLQLSPWRLIGRITGAVLAALAAGGVQAVEWRVATPYPADNYHTQNLRQFGDELARATQGNVTLQIHPNAALLKAPEIFPGVRAGRVEGGEVILSSLAKESPLFGLDALPFIVRGYDDARRLWQLSRPTIERQFAERGLQVLYAAPWPPQNLYSNRPIGKPKDLQGLRLRTYNPVTQRLAELIGAKPVTIQTAELANAIATHQVDLMLTSSWTGVETKAWTDLGYYYDVNGWIPKNVVFVSKKSFDALDPATRERVKKLAADAEERGWQLSQQNRQQFDRELVANKVKLNSPDPFLLQHFHRVGEKLAREWLAAAGSDGLDVLLRYQMDVLNLKSVTDNAQKR